MSMGLPTSNARLLREPRFTLKPVDPRFFVGRESEMEAILKTVRSGTQPKFFNLFGPLKIGRTSFIHRLRYLAMTGGEDTLYKAWFDKEWFGRPLVCLNIDLRNVDGPSTDDVRERFAHALFREFSEIVKEVNPPTSLMNGSIGSVLDELIRHMEEIDRVFYILIDRAEMLLDERISKALGGPLGMINEGVPDLGILLSFGVSDALKSDDVLTREGKIRDAILEISSVLGPLPREDLELGLLSAADQIKFLSFEERLANEDKEWVLEQAGGHPYLLNMAALSLLDTLEPRADSSPTNGDRAKAEESLLASGHNLDSFMLRTWAQLESLQRPSVCQLAKELARKHAVCLTEVEVEDIQILEVEGLVSRAPTRGEVLMPSKLVREWIKERNPKCKSTIQAAPPSASRSYVLQVSQSNGEVSQVQLTKHEAEIMKLLLKAAPGELVPNSSFYQRLYGGEPQTAEEERQWDHRLKQRFKELRKKLNSLMESNPIENVYGKGYRLMDPEIFRIYDAVDVT